jgi:exportin-T
LTIEALIETVSKGMPSSDKIELIKILRVDELISVLFELENEDEKEDVDALKEKLGRFLSATGVELFKVVDDAGNLELGKVASNLIINYFQILLKFLTNQNSSIFLSCLPFLIQILQSYKKFGGGGNPKWDGFEHFGNLQSRKSFLSDVLEKVIDRMMFDEDFDWSLSLKEEDGSEDLINGVEVRKVSFLFLSRILGRGWFDNHLRGLFSPATQTNLRSDWNHRSRTFYCKDTFSDFDDCSNLEDQSE